MFCYSNSFDIEKLMKEVTRKLFIVSELGDKSFEDYLFFRF